MAHRTLNPEKSFWLDARESTIPKHKPKIDKLDSAIAAWVLEFPGVSVPHYYGSAYEIYEKLLAAGWKYSTRYGWRK